MDPYKKKKISFKIFTKSKLMLKSFLSLNTFIYHKSFIKIRNQPINNLNMIIINLQNLPKKSQNNLEQEIMV